LLAFAPPDDPPEGSSMALIAAAPAAPLLSE
jgi:hypothetical protein